MDKKIEFTPKQLTELQTFFQQNDFTANMTLVREYDFSSERSEIFVRTKRIFGEYWLGNLRPLGVNRKMKNFSKDYEVPLVSMAVCMFSCFKCFKTQSSSCSCKVASPPVKVTPPPEKNIGTQLLHSASSSAGATTLPVCPLMPSGFEHQAQCILQPDKW